MPRLYFLHKEHENEEELVTILSKGQTWCKERQAYFIVRKISVYFRLFDPLTFMSFFSIPLE